MNEYIDIIRHYKENKQIQYFTREQLLELQLKKFRNLVKYALNTSSFYRNYYAAAGISLKNVEEIHPQDCPLTNKKMLMENFNEIVSDPILKYENLSHFINESNNFREMYKNKYWVVHTSGSGGFFGIFPFSEVEFKLIKIFYLEHIHHMDPFDLLKQMFNRKKMVYFGATHAHFAGVTLASSIPSILCDHRFFSVLEPLEDIVDNINSFQPQIITGYASSVSKLAEAQLKGLLKIHPEKIFCSGDAMHASNRAVMREAFGINPVNLYSCTEAPMLGWQANDDTEDLYVNEHMYHIDLVENKVCLSNLYLHTFPILRYHMEDSYDLLERDAVKPFMKIRLQNVRTFDKIEVINNQGQKVELPPLALVSLHVEGLEQYQFCKKPNNTLLVKAKGKGENLSEHIKDAVLNMLQETKADKVVRIEIEEVDNIPVDPKTGKFKLINAA